MRWRVLARPQKPETGISHTLANPATSPHSSNSFSSRCRSPSPLPSEPSHSAWSTWGQVRGVWEQAYAGLKVVLRAER